MEKEVYIENESEEQDDSLSFGEFTMLCRHHWRWFAISLVVCMFFATYYYHKSVPMYEQDASIMIKDEDKGTSASSDVSQAFQSMGILQSNTNVKNELLSIQSPDVATEVVKRMHLDVNYTRDGRVHAVTLYGTTLPIQVSFLGLDDMDNAGLDITLHPDGSYTLSELWRDKSHCDEQITGQWNAVLKTPVGRIKVERSLSYEKPRRDLLIHVTRTNLLSAATAVSKRFSASLADKEATVIDLSFVDTDPRRAADILNTYIAVYNENWVKDKNIIATSTSQFINERLAVIEHELGVVDNDISSYKSRELIPDVAKAGQMAMTVAQGADQAGIDLTNQLYMVQFVRNYMTGEAHRGQVLPVNTGIGNTSIAQQIMAYNTQLLQRNNLAASSSESHPLVVEMDATLKGMRASILTALDNEIVALREQIQAQAGIMGRATSQMASSPEQAKYLLSAERQQKVKENLYIFLLQKREENEISQAFTAYNTRIIAKPHGSTYPKSPVKSKIYLIAFLLALGIPMGLIYVREATNTTVRGKKDLEGVLTMPFLGEIPQLKGKHGNMDADRTVSVKKNGHHPLDEAFRVVRTNLQFLLGTDKEKNVFIITSFNPGSGKTFIAANLAASIAQSGKRVLTIDCDLRRRSLSEYAEHMHPGLSDYLIGAETDLNECIQKHLDQENLYFLVAGTMPPNPTELMLSPKFAELLQDLRSKYDCIILDCPPVDIVADTAIIEKLADRTLFVMRAGLMERSMLKQLEADYQQKKFKNMSLLLNGSKNFHSRYGYGYGYGSYGNGYGYGYYGSYGTPRKKWWQKLRHIF